MGMDSELVGKFMIFCAPVKAGPQGRCNQL